MTMRTNSISVEQENSRSRRARIQRDLRLPLDIDLKEAFALFDRVGGGVIRTRDLAFVMRSIGYQTTPVELERMIREADQDGQ